MPDQYQRKRLPYGFAFLDVTETKKLKAMSLLTEKILEENQYQPVTPAAVDFQETFEIFGRKDMFHIKDHLGDHLALRNDVTVQIIKGFCNQLERKDIQETISRYYYNVPVFTDVRKDYPSLREVQQLGAEIIGSSSEDAILEVIQVSNKILSKAFGVPYKLILGDVRLFYFLKEYLLNIELHDTVVKKDVDGLIRLMLGKGWEEKAAVLFARSLLYWKDDESLNESIRQLQKNLTGTHKNFIDDIKELLQPIFTLKKTLKKLDIIIDLDPFLTRKSKYYTSLVFEGYIDGLSFPPLRGGSYDNLTSAYSNQNVPASGFALDMSSIFR